VLPGLLGRLVPIRKAVNNFGDLLGPEIAHRLARRYMPAEQAQAGHGRLLAVGSILSLAEPGDVAWGIGANGKSLSKSYSLKRVDFRAVRGPLTRKFVQEQGGACPDVYGDPGLLVSQLWASEELTAPRVDVTVIPNLNDLPLYDLKDNRVMLPTEPLNACLSRISNSSFVIGSSLHAIVVAESFGIPARLIRSKAEPEFKYMDYYLGSGRSGYRPAESVAEALRLGGEPLPSWNSQVLIEAFPLDMWGMPAQTQRIPSDRNNQSEMAE